MSKRDWTPSVDFARGVGASIAWLHEEARRMNDPNARAVLNNAGFHLGVAKPVYVTDDWQARALAAESKLARLEGLERAARDWFERDVGLQLGRLRAEPNAHEWSDLRAAEQAVFRAIRAYTSESGE